MMTTLALMLLASMAAAGAVQVTLDPLSINQAITIGQSRIERDRVRFHAPYRLMVNRAPVDYIDVVTPFRRVALLAEWRTTIGDRSFGQRQARELMGSSESDIELWIEYTFHPQNTFVGVPGYDIALVQTGRTLMPRAVDLVPRHEPRLDKMPVPLNIPGGQPPPTSSPLLGGTAIAKFDVTSVNPNGVYDVVIADRGKELARARVDFAKLR